MVNKPIESRKGTIPEPASSFTGNDFDDCTFRGIVTKSSTNSEDTFEASAELHQMHGRSFSCLDVLMMEKESGRHVAGCKHIGFISSKACGCKGKK